MSAPSIQIDVAEQVRDDRSARGPLHEMRQSDRYPSVPVICADATARELHNIAPQARDEWLEELERYQRECGCKAGGIGAVTALASVLAWQIVATTTLSLRSATGALLEVVVLTVVGGVVGKLIGLRHARVRFRRATAKFLSHSVDRPESLMQSSLVKYRSFQGEK